MNLLFFANINYPVDTGRKLNVHKTVLDVFWTSYVRSIYVLSLRGRIIGSPEVLQWS